MNIVRFDDVEPVMWKNGGGLTRELACHAPHDDSVNFAWRITVATVSRPGDFSFFDGVDRTIVVVRGNGIILRRSGHADMPLSRDSAPFRFRGEEAIFSDVVDGPTLDLNVMTRRESFQHVVTRFDFLNKTTIECTDELATIVAITPIDVYIEGKYFSLSALDSISEIPKVTILAGSSGPAIIYYIGISKKAPD